MRYAVAHFARYSGSNFNLITEQVYEIL